MNEPHLIQLNYEGMRISLLFILALSLVVIQAQTQLPPSPQGTYTQYVLCAVYVPTSTGTALITTWCPVPSFTSIIDGQGFNVLTAPSLAVVGARGPNGYRGPQGAQGIRGPNGYRGPTSIPITIITPTPSVQETIQPNGDGTYTLSVTADEFSGPRGTWVLYTNPRQPLVKTDYSIIGNVITLQLQTPLSSPVAIDVEYYTKSNYTQCANGSCQ